VIRYPLIQIGTEDSFEMGVQVFQRNLECVAIDVENSFFLTDKRILDGAGITKTFGRPKSFSERILHGITRKNKEYFILALDDLLILDFKRPDEVQDLCQLYNPDYVALSADPVHKGRLSWTGSFTLTQATSPYRFSTQISIWKTVFAKTFFSKFRGITPHNLEKHGGIWATSLQPLTFSAKKPIVYSVELCKSGHLRPFYSWRYGVTSEKMTKMSLSKDLLSIGRGIINRFLIFLWRI
jgi:hypothetical protein